MKKSENRFLVATGIALGIAISAVGAGLGWYFGVEKPKESTTSSQPAPTSSGSSATVANENGIKANVKTFLSASNVTTYEIDYTVSPTGYTGQVEAKLEWSDTAVTETMSDYLTFVQDKTANKVTITLVKSFTHQAKLTLYSADDPSVNAIVTIDYANRITSSPVNVTVSSTPGVVEVGHTDVMMDGQGSIPIGETVKSATFTWNAEFWQGMATQIGWDAGQTHMGASMPLSATNVTVLGGILNVDLSYFTAENMRDLYISYYDGRPTYLREYTSSQLDAFINKPLINATYVLDFAGGYPAEETITNNIKIAKNYVLQPIASIVTPGVSNYVF